MCGVWIDTFFFLQRFCNIKNQTQKTSHFYAEMGFQQKWTKRSKMYKEKEKMIPLNLNVMYNIWQETKKQFVFRSLSFSLTLLLLFTSWSCSCFIDSDSGMKCMYVTKMKLWVHWAIELQSHNAPTDPLLRKINYIHLEHITNWTWPCHKGY